MKIGIDIRCLSEGRRTGVEEYTFNLLNNLFSLDRKNEYVLFFNSFSKPKISFSQWKKYPNVKIKVFRIPNKILNFLFWLFNWPKIDGIIGGTDVIFFPNIIFSSWSKKTKAILTVHDLSFERYPEHFSLKRRLWHFFINARRLCRKADKIITVSDSSKDDITELYNIPEEKINVIYSAVSEEFRVIDRNDFKLIEIKEKYGLPYKFILFLGTIEPRKNIIAIIRAYNQFRELENSELKKYKLVIAGEKGWKGTEIFSEIKNSPYLKDILKLGFISPEDKPYFYNLASLFIYPSFFEGFGFPPLEAMKCSVPVIASNNSSIPEIVGSAGILVDPEKPQEICSAMKEILLSKELVSKLKEKGVAQSRKFSWKKTAEETLKLIHQ